MVENTGIRVVGLGIAAVATAMALPRVALAAYEEHLLPGALDPLVTVPAGGPAPSGDAVPARGAGVASRPAGAASDAGGRGTAAKPARKRPRQGVASRPDSSRGQRDRAAPGLHHSGPHPRVAGMRTVGQDVPFAYALRLVTPLGWAIDNGLPDTESAASWRVGEPWSNVLHRAARDAGATLYVDWGARRIVVRRAGLDPLADAPGNGDGRPGPATGENAAAAAVRGVGLDSPDAGVPAERERPRPAPAGTAGVPGRVPEEGARGALGGIVLPGIGDPGRGFLDVTMTAGEAARALGLDAAAFCRWNAVEPGTTLVRGRAVRLRDYGSPAEGDALPGGGYRAAERAADAARVTEPAGGGVAGGDQPASAPAGPDATGGGEVSGPSALVAPGVLRSAAADRQLSAPKPARAPAEAAEGAYPLEPGTLIAQLSLWCDRAGYQLVWKADRDVEILSHVTYRGTFAGSLSNVFRDLAAAGQAFRVTLFERNRVVEVADS